MTSENVVIFMPNGMYVSTKKSWIYLWPHRKKIQNEKKKKTVVAYFSRTDPVKNTYILV